MPGPSKSRDANGQRAVAIVEPKIVQAHMRRRGMQSAYDDDTATLILDRMADGETLNQICRDLNYPPATVRGWALDDKPPGFAQRYARARQMGIHSIVDQCVEEAANDINDVLDGDKGPIPNNAAVARSKLIIDNLHWLASKIVPKVYGDKVVLGGDPENPIKMIGSHMTAQEAAQAYADTIARKLK